MQSYHRVHVALRRKDGRQIAEMLRKGQESARARRRASILRQLEGGQRVGWVAENAGVAPKTIRPIARRHEEEGLDSALYEKPVVLHADVRPPRPMRPGRAIRRDCEYQRRGTASAFCGVEPKAGRHFTQATPTALRPSSPIIC